MCDEEEAYCRLCAEPTTKETLISPDEDVGMNSKITTKLSWINVDVSTSNTLPKSICFSCFDLLERTWLFLHNVRSAQTKLNDIFNKKDDKENSSSEVKTDPNSIGKPINVDWEDFEEMEQKVKPEIINDELQRVSVDPNSLIDLAAVKIERLSVDSILENSNDFNSTDSDIPLYTAVKKKKFKRKLNRIKYSSDLDTKTNKPNLKESEDCPTLTWDEYMCRCADCDAVCMNIVSLRLHALQIHARCCTFKCLDCGKVLTTYKTFINHVRTHRKLLKCCCEFCNKRFTEESCLKKHKQTFHISVKRTACQYCGTTFENEEQLEYHLIMYTKRNQVNRKRVLKCKIKDSNLKCDLCKKQFKSHSNLQQHMAVHSERTKDFSCHVCGKTFFTIGALRNHLTVHDDAKPYQCEFCPLAFRARGNLVSHISLHSGTKPFVCEQCGKSFRIKKHLKSHSIVHTDLTPYQCEYCKKKFKFKTRLNMHLRQHTGVKPYTCDTCQHDFTNGSNFKKHMMRKHNIDTSQKKPYQKHVLKESCMDGSDAETVKT